MVFGIFAQVAECSGFFDLARQLGGELVLEDANLFFQLFFDLVCHLYVTAISSSDPIGQMPAISRVKQLKSGIPPISDYTALPRFSALG
jgi:hypothetical protein